MLITKNIPIFFSVQDIKHPDKIIYLRLHKDINQSVAEQLRQM